MLLASYYSNVIHLPPPSTNNYFSFNVRLYYFLLVNLYSDYLYSIFICKDVGFYWIWVYDEGNRKIPIYFLKNIVYFISFHKNNVTSSYVKIDYIFHNVWMCFLSLCLTELSIIWHKVNGFQQLIQLILIPSSIGAPSVYFNEREGPSPRVSSPEPPL